MKSRCVKYGGKVKQTQETYTWRKKKKKVDKREQKYNDAMKEVETFSWSPSYG